MDTLKVKTGLSNLTKGGQPCYQLYVKNPKSLSQTDFVKLFAARLGKGEAEARFINDVHGQVLCEAVVKNKSVNVGCMRAQLDVTGSVASAGAPLTKDNIIKVSLIPHGALKECVAGISAVNETISIGAVLYTVQYEHSDELNTIEGLGAVKINGDKLYINQSKDDEGVWLEDETGTMVTNKAAILENDNNFLTVEFSDLPEAGNYRLVIATRGGSTDEDVGVDRLTRQVKVTYVASV